jgi:peptide-methionine (S)-S-oxide reductase
MLPAGSPQNFVRFRLFIRQTRKTIMQLKSVFPTLILAAIMLTACAQKSTDSKTKVKSKPAMSENAKLDTITLAGGCFWCVEAIYQRLNGVISVTSGYAGGHVKNPAYREVCNGTTGHAEAVQIVYDANVVSLAEIFKVFFKVHDPTTLNRQGNDEGTQYRSAIFFHNADQLKVAVEVKTGLDKSGAFNAPIVTEITPFTNFYKAEDYHQDYYNQNKYTNSYCQFVIVPKIEKFESYFKDELRK